jgi:hypothetical protein
MYTAASLFWVACRSLRGLWLPTLRALRGCARDRPVRGNRDGRSWGRRRPAPSLCRVSHTPDSSPIECRLVAPAAFDLAVSGSLGSSFISCSEWSRTMRRCLLLVAVAILVLGFVGSASATFPGSNGLILFRDDHPSSGVGNPLFRAGPDGSDVGVLSRRPGLFRTGGPMGAASRSTSFSAMGASRSRR